MTLGQAAVILARQVAIAEVKTQLRHQGLKPQFMARKVIVGLANEWLRQHQAELREAAFEKAERLLAGSKVKT